MYMGCFFFTLKLGDVFVQRQILTPKSYTVLYLARDEYVIFRFLITLRLETTGCVILRY